MVIQQGLPFRVFGKAAPGAKIEVIWKKARRESTVGDDGVWSVVFPASRAGGPFDLTVTDGRQTRKLTNILIGEVWLCSGQSNMEMLVSSCANAEAEMGAASYPKIRHFKVARNPSATPLEDVEGEWVVCDPRTVGPFTAAGYYFAREIQKKTKVPVGLLHSSWGGTPIEAWLPREVFTNNERYRENVKFQETLEKSPRKLAPEIKRRQREWHNLYVSKDPGNRGLKQGWAKPDFNESNWPKMALPGAWEGQGLMIDGAVWFRRRVKIPAAWTGRELKLELGSLDDFDVTYFNGREIGRMGKSIPNAYKTPRVYTIPADLVQSGEAVIAVRIFDQFGSGGFTGAPDQLRLSCPGQGRAIPLKGEWPYQIEWSVDRSVPSPAMPDLPEPRAQLSYLYNGMISALTGFPVRGVLWYQGESNVPRSTTYDHLFTSLIRSWRKVWKQKDMPFLFVQLANFKSVPTVPGNDPWAEVREAQTKALQLPHTGMAVAIDIGEAGDIHPRNKQDVGLRLARLALNRVYGRKIADSGPILASCKLTKTGAVLKFSNCGTGLKTADDKALRGFAIADRTRQWQWVDAQIKGPDTVVIKTKATPAALRYGWAGNPDCNLTNSHGLPTSPFRTDRWPRVTEGVAWPF